MIKEKQIINFLKRNQNPKDERVHMWAMKNGYKVDAVEEAIYKLASKHVKERRYNK